MAEINDKDGWVYDPDAKLAEIRASLLDALWKSRRETEGTHRLGVVYVDDALLKQVCGRE